MERRLPATQPAAPSNPPVEAAGTEEATAKSVLEKKARALAVKVKAGELSHGQAVEVMVAPRNSGRAE